MFGWLRKKRTEPLVFPSSQAAFDHACSTGYQLLINARIPALVVQEGEPGRGGERWYLLRLAAAGGVQEVWANLLPGAPAQPELGDFVSFRIVRIATELPDDASLVGYIDCRLTPVLVEGKGWRTDISFAPASLKPELHL